MMKKFFTKYCSPAFCFSILGIGFVYGLTRIGLIYPEKVELVYSQSLYPVLSRLLSFISNVFPFSLDDLFYACLIVIVLLFTILLFMRKLSFISYLRRLVILIAILYGSFNLFWGFNYLRQDLGERLELKTAKADVNELMEVFGWLVDEVNRTYTPVYSIDKKEVMELIQGSYNKQADFLKVNTSLLDVKAKPISLSSLFAAATISGYYGPFFSEVHLNKHLMPLDYPMVLAHEMAHKLGIASEAEANFYAWLVCSASEDKRLAYSANLYLLQYFVYECRKLDGFREVVKNIRYEVRHDFYKSHYHWMALMDRNIELVATKVNDAYLKSNNVEEGIEDYEGVVKYVMDYKLTKR